jgi:hypothetical protein
MDAVRLQPATIEHLNTQSQEGTVETEFGHWGSA